LCLEITLPVSANLRAHCHVYTIHWLSEGTVQSGIHWNIDYSNNNKIFINI